MKNNSDNAILAASGKYIPAWAGQLVSKFLDNFALMCLSHVGCDECPLLGTKCNPYGKAENFDFEAAYDAVIGFIREEE